MVKSAHRYRTSIPIVLDLNSSRLQAAESVQRPLEASFRIIDFFCRLSVLKRLLPEVREKKVIAFSQRHPSSVKYFSSSAAGAIAPRATFGSSFTRQLRLSCHVVYVYVCQFISLVFGSWLQSCAFCRAVEKTSMRPDTPYLAQTPWKWHG